MRIVSRLALVILGIGCGGRVVDLDAPSKPDVDPPSEGERYISEEMGATELVVDATRLYWVNMKKGNRPTAAIRSCLKSDCAGTVETYASASRAERYPSRLPVYHSLAVDAVNVYWVEEPASLPGFTFIRVCPRDGCGGPPRTIVASTADQLAVDGTNVYFASNEDRAIYCCPVGECSAPEALVLDQLFINRGSLGALLVRGGDLYWMAQAERQQAAIWRMPKDGSIRPIMMTDNLQSAMSMSIVDDYVYWVNHDVAGTVVRCPRAGCAGALEILAVNVPNPTVLAADSRGAYWFNFMGEIPPSCNCTSATDPLTARGDLWSCAAGDCAGTSRLVAHIQADYPVSLALDAEYVYWTVPGPLDVTNAAYSSSAIYRARRPH